MNDKHIKSIQSEKQKMKKTKTKTKTTKQHKCSESELSKTMVLQLAQKNFAAVGIVPNLTAQPYPLKKLFKFINDADDAGVFGECPLAQACFSNTI